MKVELQCGDTITIPKGCKAIVKGESVEIEKAQKFKDGDVLVVVIDNVEYSFIFFNTTEERCWHHVCLYPDGEIRRTWFFYYCCPIKPLHAALLSLNAAEILMISSNFQFQAPLE